MYRIEAIGSRRRRRVISDSSLGESEFRQIAADLGVAPKHARKTGLISAHEAAGGEHVETRWNGKETEARAAAGDWIVTALGPDGAPLRDSEGNANVYVVKADRFAALYEPVGPAGPGATTFRPKGVVEAIRVTGGFEIQAPWGETQRAADGWLLLNGGEVYGNHRDTFAVTYELLD